MDFPLNSMKTATAPGEGLVRIGRRALVELQQKAGDIPLRAVRIRSQSHGGHLSRFKGRGMEFDEARPYQPGDDIRNIDWRVTARTGTTHTKLYREERERAVLFWVDFRAPMYFATHGRFKTVLASRAAAVLAWAARRQGDRLGGLLFTEQGHRELRPQLGDAGVMTLIGALSDHSAQSPAESDPDLRRNSVRSALARLRRVARPGSLIFLLSDFRGLDHRCDNHLAALSRHNDLVLVHLHDRLEQELPQAGRYRIGDGLRNLLIDTGDRVRRAGHHERYQRHIEALEAMCRRYRMHLLHCSTEEDVVAVLRSGLGGMPR